MTKTTRGSLGHTRAKATPRHHMGGVFTPRRLANETYPGAEHSPPLVDVRKRAQLRGHKSKEASTERNVKTSSCQAIDYRVNEQGQRAIERRCDDQLRDEPFETAAHLEPAPSLPWVESPAAPSSQMHVDVWSIGPLDQLHWIAWAPYQKTTTRQTPRSAERSYYPIARRVLRSHDKAARWSPAPW